MMFIQNTIMNIDLRDFLNCKEDGTENYEFNEVINSNDMKGKQV